MGRGGNKAANLVEMERKYLIRAYSDAEMADALGVDRTTAYRYRLDLTPQVFIVSQPDGRWKIDRSRYLSNVRLNLYESVVLYLAARRVSHHATVPLRHAANALEKLAGPLHKPMTGKLIRAADQILSKKGDADRQKIFETVVQAWAEGVRLRIRYHGLKAKHAYTHVVSPYLIEPSPWSDSVYLIAYSDVMEDIVPFKLERVEAATLTTERVRAQEDFDERELLKYAWGVWRGKTDPEIVRLKFAPGTATRRLKESVWHPLETVTDTEDGGCTWEAPVAEWVEMLPFIRGWGSECEVVGPRELRMEIIRETRKLSRMYVTTQEKPVSPDDADFDTQRLTELFRG